MALHPVTVRVRVPLGKDFHYPSIGFYVSDAIRPYLSVSDCDGYVIGSTCDAEQMRALARAILRTVPAPKKRNTKRRK